MISPGWTDRAIQIFSIISVVIVSPLPNLAKVGEEIFAKVIKSVLFSPRRANMSNSLKYRIDIDTTSLM